MPILNSEYSERYLASTCSATPTTKSTDDPDTNGFTCRKLTPCAAGQADLAHSLPTTRGSPVRTSTGTEAVVRLRLLDDDDDDDDDDFVDNDKFVDDDEFVDDDDFVDTGSDTDGGPDEADADEVWKEATWSCNDEFVDDDDFVDTDSDSDGGPDEADADEVVKEAPDEADPWPHGRNDPMNRV
jgi:hypothetical protein